MNERTATPGQGGSTAGKPPTSDRYSAFSTKQLEAAGTWLRDQGPTPWSKRFRIEGDNVFGDLRGMPPVIRQIVCDYFDAIQLLTPKQIRQLVAVDIAARVQLVDQVLTEAGR